MITLRPTASTLVAALALSACADHMQTARGPDCATPEARLAELGVATDDIVSVLQTNERAVGGVISRHAWVRLKSCSGYLVIRLDSSCGPRGSDPYTTGNCRLPEKRVG
jgi:hypothetical protein